MKSKEQTGQSEYKGNVYHITFFKSKDNRYSTGVNIEAFSMLEALANFNKDYEGIDPFSIVEKTNYELIRDCNVCTDEMI